jgi:hypothetical protein
LDVVWSILSQLHLNLFCLCLEHSLQGAPGYTEALHLVESSEQQTQKEEIIRGLHNNTQIGRCDLVMSELRALTNRMDRCLFARH